LTNFPYGRFTAIRLKAQNRCEWTWCWASVLFPRLVTFFYKLKQQARVYFFDFIFEMISSFLTHIHYAVLNLDLGSGITIIAFFVLA
jgi:hypothetical protein